MVRAAPTRWIIAAAGALLTALAPAGVAGADPAGPTDFETIVVSVTPPSEAIDVDVIGGDSFLQLTAAPGTEVIVEGYQQEPYLRFRPDGVVEENRRSPTTYLNASRYGGDDVPAGADATLPPDWQPVGSGGRYAWHDHRIHLMQRGTPAVGGPGDQVQAATVAMDVNGEPVDVAVAVYWLPAPSRVPLAVGAAIGAGLVILAVVTRHRLAWPLLAVAVAAAGIGWWQFSSLPSETGPLLVWWLLPAIATVSVVVALALGRRLVAYCPGPARGDRAGRLGGAAPRGRVAGVDPDRRALLARSRGHGGDRRGCRGGGDRGDAQHVPGTRRLRRRTAAARPWPTGKTTACDGTPVVRPSACGAHEERMGLIRCAALRSPAMARHRLLGVLAAAALVAACSDGPTESGSATTPASAAPIATSGVTDTSAAPETTGVAQTSAPPETSGRPADDRTTRRRVSGPASGRAVPDDGVAGR